MEFEQLNLDKNTVIMGVGNLLRGDDGIGVYVAEQLIDLGFNGVFNCREVPENYLVKVCKKNPKKVLIIDAADIGGDAGELIFLTGESFHQGISTHTAGIDVISEYIKKTCGADVFVAAVQPSCFEGEFSLEVLNTGKKLVSILKDKLCMNQ